MEMTAHVRFSKPPSAMETDDFLVHLEDYVENVMNGMPTVDTLGAVVHVTWYFDSDDSGFNTEMIRLLAAVTDFLVDNRMLTPGMQFHTFADVVEL